MGKTSIACAAGIQLAEAGRRVLLVGTDPASNVGQVFGVNIGNRITDMHQGGQLSPREGWLPQGLRGAGVAQLVFEPFDRKNALFLNEPTETGKEKVIGLPRCHQRIYFRARFAKQGRPDVSMG